MDQLKNQGNDQQIYRVVTWWLIGLACFGFGGGVVAPLTTEDLMLDIGYGILVAKIVHGFILGTILGVSISALLLGFSALWVSVKRYNPGAASFGAMLIGGALMLGFERLLEPAPNTVADAFEQMGHDIAALPVHTLALVLAALAVEGLAFAWHRYRHHEQQ